MIRMFIPDSGSGFFSFRIRRISDFRGQKTTEQEKWPWGFGQLPLAKKLGLLYFLLFLRIASSTVHKGDEYQSKS
jgi:hypothetical protein